MSKMETLGLKAYQREALENFCGHYDDVEIYEDYSGRGMWGAECFGIEIGRELQPCSILMELAMYLTEMEDQNLVNMMVERLREDSMGLGIIVYFPGLEWDKDKIKL